jgi:hypothetical protein
MTNMLRNLFEMVFWSAAVAVTFALYLESVTDAELRTLASQEEAPLAAQSDSERAARLLP